MEELIGEVQLEDAGEISGNSLLRLFLKHDEVFRLDQNSFAWIAQSTVQIDPYRYLTAVRSSAKSRPSPATR